MTGFVLLATLGCGGAGTTATPAPVVVAPTAAPTASSSICAVGAPANGGPVTDPNGLLTVL